MNKETELAETTGMQVIEKKELIERETVKGTPFQVITTEEGSFIAMGKYRLTDFTSQQDCYELIETKSWELIGSYITVIAEEILKTKSN